MDATDSTTLDLAEQVELVLVPLVLVLTRSVRRRPVTSTMRLPCWPNRPTTSPPPSQEVKAERLTERVADEAEAVIVAEMPAEVEDVEIADAAPDDKLLESRAKP